MTNNETALRDALIRLTLETRHYLNTGVGLIFLREALADADHVLVASKPVERVHQPDLLEPTYRLMPHAE